LFLFKSTVAGNGHVAKQDLSTIRDLLEIRVVAHNAYQVDWQIAELVS